MPIAADQEITVVFKRHFILDVPSKMEAAAVKTIDQKLQKGFMACAALFRQAAAGSDLEVRIRRPIASWRWLVGGADQAKCHALSMVLKAKLDLLEIKAQDAADRAAAKREFDRRTADAMQQYMEGEDGGR